MSHTIVRILDSLLLNNVTYSNSNPGIRYHFSKAIRRFFFHVWAVA